MITTITIITVVKGPNCKTPSGKVIKEGETLTEDGMTCTCTMETRVGREAQCTSLPPFTTAAPTPPTTCELASVCVSVCVFCESIRCVNMCVSICVCARARVSVCDTEQDLTKGEYFNSQRPCP